MLGVAEEKQQEKIHLQIEEQITNIYDLKPFAAKEEKQEQIGCTIQVM